MGRHRQFAAEVRRSIVSRKAGHLVLVLAVLSLAGCTSMMLGGANSGGYQPPKDECTGTDKDEGCRSK